MGYSEELVAQSRLWASLIARPHHCLFMLTGFFSSEKQMRDYSKISPNLWQSARFNGLPSDDARYVYLYLLTSSHQTSAGCYRLPNAYAADDLKWPEARYLRARDELISADLIKYDPDNTVVMITRWFRFNPPMNEKHEKGIRHVLERIPSQSIWEAASAELDAVVEEEAASARDKSTPAKTWKGWKPRQP